MCVLMWNDSSYLRVLVVGAAVRNGDRALQWRAVNKRGIPEMPAITDRQTYILYILPIKILIYNSLDSRTKLLRIFRYKS